MAKYEQARSQEVTFEITKRSERAIKVKIVRPVAFPAEVWLPKSQIGGVVELTGKDAGLSYAVLPKWLYDAKVQEAKTGTKSKPDISSSEFNELAAEASAKLVSMTDDEWRHQHLQDDPSWQS